MPRLLVLLALAFGTPSALLAQATGDGPRIGCAADLDALERVVSRDYAGYRTKAAARPEELATLTRDVHSAVRDAADADACTVALQRWVAFFADPHLQLWETRPSRTAGSASQSAASPDGQPTADSRLPSLTFVNDSTAELALPDFGDRYKPAIDSLISNNRSRLLATPYLVIDVRRNGGGWTASYDAILPLIYTDPIQVPGMEAWASDGNIAAMRQIIDSDRAEGIKRAVMALLPKMEANREQFVTISEDREFRLDTVHPMPRAVAVVVGRGCVSTCEQFVLDARQSRKVTVMGAANTGGFTDYGNVRRVDLPSGVRRLQLPTSRSRRLPENPMDVVGIAPEVRIPPDAPDPLAFARAHLYTRNR